MIWWVTSFIPHVSRGATNLLRGVGEIEPQCSCQVLYLRLGQYGDLTQATLSLAVDSATCNLDLLCNPRSILHPMTVPHARVWVPDEPIIDII